MLLLKASERSKQAFSPKSIKTLAQTLIRSTPIRSKKSKLNHNKRARECRFHTFAKANTYHPCFDFRLANWSPFIPHLINLLHLKAYFLLIWNTWVPQKVSRRQLDFVSNLGLWEVEFSEQIDKLPPKRPELANFPLKYKCLNMTFKVNYLWSMMQIIKCP